MHRNRINRRTIASAIENLEGRRLFAGATPELIAVVDGTQGFGNTRRAVAFYDITDIRTGSGVFGQTPLFSIWTGYELTDYVGTGNDRNFEDPAAFTTSDDGGTGYLLAFDSGAQGSPDIAGDTQGDYDLYRLDIRAAYSDFVANNRPRGVMYLPRVSSDFRANNPANGGIDYVAAYGSRPLGPTGLPDVTDTDAGIAPGRNNANASGADDVVFLSGSSAKVGEVGRRGAAGTTPFFDQQDIQYVDDETLLLMENTTAASPTVTGSLGQDYSIRTIERLSTTPGQAAVGSDDTGGYNGNTTESWQSFAWTGDNFVDMDNNAATQAISDVDGMRYVNRNGVQGVWVSDRDGGGDDLAFFGLNFDTRVADKQEQRTGPSPYPTSFALDENPEVDANTNDGDLDGFDLDANGNLVLRESGNFDTPQVEPKIITRAIANYNAGDSDSNTVGEITFGAWDTKANLSPTIDDDALVTDGRFGVYDKAQNIVYVFDTDAAGAGLVADVYAYDLTTETLIYQELDAANNFFSDGNRIRAFTLRPTGDTIAPTVALSYSNLTNQAVTLTFSEDVAASFTAGDLVLRNNTTNTVIPTADLTLTPLGGNVYQLTYKTGAATTPLPKGRYTLTVTGSGITDAAGNAVAGTPSVDFNVLPGDINGDGTVNFADLVILAQGYNTSGKNYAQGNLDYNAGGNINFADLVILAQNYNTSLAPAPLKTAAPRVPTIASNVLGTGTTIKGERVAKSVL